MPKLYTQTRFNSICNCKSKSHPHFLRSFLKLKQFSFHSGRFHSSFIHDNSNQASCRLVANQNKPLFCPKYEFRSEEVRDSVFFGYLIAQNDRQSNSGFVLYFQKRSLLIKPFPQKPSFLMVWRLNAANFLKIINFPWRLEPSRLDRSSSELCLMHTQLQNDVACTKIK